MCIGVVTTIAAERSPHGLTLCVDAQSGKQQLMVTDFDDHRLLCVDLQTGTYIENGCWYLVFVADRPCVGWVCDVRSSGAMSAFAGTGKAGHTNTSAALSQFHRPESVCFDTTAGGSVICTDFHSVRRIKNGE
jgi:hypothetical protein